MERQEIFDRLRSVVSESATEEIDCVSGRDRVITAERLAVPRFRWSSG